MADLLNNDSMKDQWSHAVSYAQRNGGIMPGKAVSFKSTPDKYVIRAHRGRWISNSLLYAFVILHYLPLLIPVIIPSDKEFPYEKMIPLAVFGLFWLYLAFRLSIPIGKVTFDRESSNIHIVYGTIIRNYKIVIPKEYVSLKTYMFKADKPDVRIKYGNTVLSFVNQNEPDSELILASVKNEKNILLAYEKLVSYLNIEGADNAELPSPSTLMDTPKDEWQQLSERSQSKGAFLGHRVLKSDRIVVKDNSEQTLIKPRKPWISGLFVSSFGLFFIVMNIIISIKEQEFSLFMTIFSFGISLIFLAPAYRILASSNRMLLRKWNNSIDLRYGVFPFSKEVSFSSSSFEVCLYTCSVELANKVKKPGQIILSLLRRNPDDSKLVISTSGTELQVISAFEKLKSFLGQSSQDGLSSTLEVSNGEQIDVPRTLLSGNKTDNERKYCIIDEDLVAFKYPWFYLVIFALLFFMGLWCSIGFMNEEPAEKLSQKILSMILIYGVGGFMILGGIGLFFQTLFTRCIIANKMLNSLHYSPFVNKTSRGKAIIKLSEIEAIQLCSIYTSVQSGNTRKGAMVYEVNVITKHDDKRRIGITSSSKFSQIQPAAIAFAEFLEVPLLDHIAE